MKRWNGNAQRSEEIPAADAFLEEVIAVCRKHGFSLGHEDGHGAFLIQDIEGSEHNFAWLREAHFEATAPASDRPRLSGTSVTGVIVDDASVLRDCVEELIAVADIVHASGDMERYQNLNDAVLRGQLALKEAGVEVPVGTPK